MTYSIEEHKHRFAAWTAGRAANVNGCRFKVQHGKKLLEIAGFHKTGNDVENLPSSIEFDNKHLEWRNTIIHAARNFDLNFTHGVAAKLINVYLKSIFVCSGKHCDERVKSIHPPIDSVLLNALYQQNIGGKSDVWQVARKIRWSKLNSEQYQNVITAIKEVLPAGYGLWKIEEYWKGYQ